MAFYDCVQTLSSKIRPPSMIEQDMDGRLMLVSTDVCLLSSSFVNDGFFVFRGVPSACAKDRGTSVIE